MSYGPSYKMHSYTLTLGKGKHAATCDLIRNLSGEKATEVTHLGILKLDGDRLTLSYNATKQGRPTAFDGPGKGAFTAVYRRKTP